MSPLGGILGGCHTFREEWRKTPLILCCMELCQRYNYGFDRTWMAARVNSELKKGFNVDSVISLFMCTMGAGGCWTCASTGWVQQSERESKLLIQAFSASSCHIKAPNQSCKLVGSSTRLPNDKEEQSNMRWRGNVLWLKWEADGGKRWGDVPCWRIV